MTNSDVLNIDYLVSIAKLAALKAGLAILKVYNSEDFGCKLKFIQNSIQVSHEKECFDVLINCIYINKIYHKLPAWQPIHETQDSRRSVTFHQTTSKDRGFLCS